MARGSEGKKVAEGEMKGKRTQGVSMEAQVGSQRRWLDTGDVLFVIWLEVRKEQLVAHVVCMSEHKRYSRKLKQKQLQSAKNPT